MMILKFIAVVAVFIFSQTFLQANEKPNVLLIAIDDLNDWTGCLGGHPQARTPCMDVLAERGTLFTNAHCQAPICNPSRTSVMLGLRPSTSGIYLNRPWFRTTRRNRDRITLPQYFGSHGYVTLTTGKIYHGSKVDEASFQVVGPRQFLESHRIDQADLGVERDSVPGTFDQVGAERTELGQGLAQIVTSALFPGPRPKQRCQMVTGLRAVALDRQVCKQCLRLSVGEIDALVLTAERLERA